MHEEPLGPVIRREIRRRVLGPSARCSCGQSDPLTLHPMADGASAPGVPPFA